MIFDMPFPVNTLSHSSQKLLHYQQHTDNKRRMNVRSNDTTAANGKKNQKQNERNKKKKTAQFTFQCLRNEGKEKRVRRMKRR